MSDVAVQEFPPEKAQRRDAVGLQVCVRSITPEATDIKAYEVVDAAGGPLPPFEPGSHIDVHLPDEGLGVRQYSLCGDPLDCSRYLFTVQREAEGRGGSKSIFENVHPGTILTISKPRNRFPLHENAQRHLLLAGGIGITPIMAMVCQLQRTDADFTLHYCARSPERTAFMTRLRPLVETGRAFIHWDGGDPSKGLDVKAVLDVYADGTHLYYCGPPAFMSAVSAAAAHWPPGTTHREYFTPSALDPVGSVDSTAADEGALGAPFKVKLARTGQTFDVPGDKTILNVLREHGVEVETACELGVCGTCRTRYLEGEPDHRDFVLEEQEHQRELTVCCSRSKSPLLVLDL